MANPRKFSEKIALHNSRQRAETEEFEKIMAEMTEIKPCDEAPHTKMSNFQPRSQSKSPSPGGKVRGRYAKSPGRSPYSGPYLTPADTGWSRTHSDSALYQTSLMQGNVDRNEHTNRGSWGNINLLNGPDRHFDGRPRSSCDVSRVPGIHIYPSAHEPGIIPIPIGTNTGSLPDLTNINNVTSPIQVPLDQDQENSPYNSSNHLSVPDNSRYQQRHNNISQNVPDFTQLGGMSGMYQQQCSPTSPSPTQSTDYRSPRPSPQSSPSLGGRHSAPCSPGAPSPLSNDYSSIFNPHQAMHFQESFEQLSMGDTPVSSTMSYVDQSQTSPQMTHSHPQSLSEVTTLGNIDIIQDGYCSTSPSQQMVYPSTSPGLQNTTPNTPTSLPEIILTDFSEERQEELQRQLDTELFSEDLRSLDLYDIQILNSSTIPEVVEENFIRDYNS